jgi:ABC-type oligopeptide transport system substrate-binding subunit
LGWSPDYSHPQSYLEILCSDQSFGTPDVAFCGALRDGLEENDEQEQVAFYRSISGEVYEDWLLVPVVYVRDAVVVRHDVAGALPAALYAASFQDLFYATARVYLPVIVRGGG